MIGALVDALLPPTGLAVLALVLLLAGRWRSAAAALSVLTALSMQGVAGSLLASLTPPVQPNGAVPGAIVILSGDGSTAVEPFDTRPRAQALERLRTGAALQRRTSLPILVTGGREADAVAASLRDDFRVPVRWTAADPRNIWQSAAASAAVLREAGIALVFLVVDEPEQRLVGRVFRQAGLEVTLAPVRRPDPLRLDAVALVPVTATWLDSAVAIRQWAGLACNALPPCLAMASRSVAARHPT